MTFPFGLDVLGLTPRKSKPNAGKSKPKAGRPNSRRFRNAMNSLRDAFRGHWKPPKYDYAKAGKAATDSRQQRRARMFTQEYERARVLDIPRKNRRRVARERAKRLLRGDA